MVDQLDAPLLHVGNCGLGCMWPGILLVQVRAFLDHVGSLAPQVHQECVQNINVVGRMNGLPIEDVVGVDAATVVKEGDHHDFFVTVTTSLPFMVV